MIIFIDDKPIQIIEEKEFIKQKAIEDFDQLIDNRLEAFKIQNLSARVVVLNTTNNTIEKFFTDLFDGKIGAYQAICFVVNDLAKTEEQIKTYYKIVKAAGGVVLNEANEVLLMYRLKKWDLPKGKKEGSETSRQTALREVEEECNIKVSITNKVCTTWHTYSMNGSRLLKRTKWYEMRCNDASKMKPQMEEDIEELRWMNAAEIKQALLNSYSSIRFVFSQFQNK